MEDQTAPQSTPPTTPPTTAKPNEPVSFGDWMITMLIMAIPLVGLIMLFVWAFSAGTAPSKANWAKAALVWIAISIALSFLFLGSILAMLGGNYNSY